MKGYRERIICLTEETTEALYLMGAQDRIVGVSTHTVRPPEARKKPRVSTFVKAKLDMILDLKPDLVLGFSNVQADIAQELIKAGLEVYVFNHRDIGGIFSMINILGALIGENEKAEELNAMLRGKIEDNRYQGDVNPKVYFEEWFDPIISGIGWVSEIISIAGGQDVFCDLAKKSLAGDRIVEADQVVVKNPDLIVVSWCGKAFIPRHLYERPNWEKINAVQNQQVHEVNSSILLQPGPGCILEGLPAMRKLIDAVRG